MDLRKCDSISDEIYINVLLRVLNDTRTSNIENNFRVLSSVILLCHLRALLSLIVASLENIKYITYLSVCLYVCVYDVYISVCMLMIILQWCCTWSLRHDLCRQIKINNNIMKLLLIKEKLDFSKDHRLWEGQFTCQ